MAIWKHAIYIHYKLHSLCNLCDSLTDEHDGDAPVPLLPVSLLLGGEGERGGLRRLQHLPQQQERRRQHDRSRDDQHAHRVRDHDVVPEAKKERLIIHTHAVMLTWDSL